MGLGGILDMIVMKGYGRVISYWFVNNGAQRGRACVRGYGGGRISRAYRRRWMLK